MQLASERSGVWHHLFKLLLVALLCATGTARSADTTALRVVVISDLNGSYGSTDYHAEVDRAVQRILTLQPDLVISAGDMVAGQRRPHLSRQQVEAMWQSFHRHVSEPLAAAGIPLAVTPGNHDASAYHGFERERAVFAEQWSARKPGLDFVDDAAYPWHYAFSQGDTLFIALDVTRVGALDQPQKQWLAGLLRQHGADYRHRIVFSHVPLWPTTRGRETEFSGDLQLEQILREGGVGIYINGHQHGFYPGFRHDIALLGLSCLGSAPRRLIGTSTTTPRSFALLEITGDRIQLAALQAPRYDSGIPWRSLPLQIESAAATIERADRAQQLLVEMHAIPTTPGSP